MAQQSQHSALRRTHETRPPVEALPRRIPHTRATRQTASVCGPSEQPRHVSYHRPHTSRTARDDEARERSFCFQANGVGWRAAQSHIPRGPIATPASNSPRTPVWPRRSIASPAIFAAIQMLARPTRNVPELHGLGRVSSGRRSAGGRQGRALRLHVPSLRPMPRRRRSCWTAFVTSGSSTTVVRMARS